MTLRFRPSATFLLCSSNRSKLQRIFDRPGESR